MTTKEIARKAPAVARVGKELDVAFTDLLANGQAVGRFDGVVVFCFGPLPQERARVAVSSVKQKYVVAQSLRIEERSPQRVEPFCPVFGECGGCQVQHLDYFAQLAWKKNVLRDALQRIGGFGAADVRDPIRMAVPRAYRNKMSLVVDRGDVIGFYKQRSHDVVPIDACPIVVPQLSAYVAALNDLRADATVGPALREARHLVVRAAQASGQAVLTVTTARESAAARRAAPALMKALPGVVGVTNSFDLSSENAIVGRKHRVLAGTSEIEETMRGVRYRVSAGSFFQVNVDVVEGVFDYLEPHLKRTRKIVDFYCGVGTFSLYFAARGCEVFGIEENAHAVAEARANAELNALQGRARFREGRVEEAVTAAEGRAALANADVAFLDPPRKGSDEASLSAVAAAAVPEIWYLSCDPATLARDLKFLASKGYRLGAVQPFDMFPQTGHVEALAFLEHHNRPE